MSSPFQQKFSEKSPLNQGLIFEDDKRPREVISAEIKKAREKREAVMGKPKPTVLDKLPKNKAKFKPSSELSDEEIQKMKSRKYKK